MLRADLLSVTDPRQFLKKELRPSSYGKSLLTCLFSLNPEVVVISRNDFFLSGADVTIRCVQLAPLLRV
jgi:hypothetical protein